MLNMIDLPTPGGNCVKSPVKITRLTPPNGFRGSKTCLNLEFKRFNNVGDNIEISSHDNKSHFP